MRQARLFAAERHTARARRPILRVLGLSLVLGLAAPHLGAPVAAQEPRPSGGIDWKRVEAAMGRSGAVQAGGVYRFGMPRSDLTVTVQGVRLRPALALGSWIAFLPHDGAAVAMGDLVLKEDEVASVMSRLQQGGIEQTAVHHHVLHESPRIVYMTATP